MFIWKVSLVITQEEDNTNGRNFTFIRQQRLVFTVQVDHRRGFKCLVNCAQHKIKEQHNKTVCFKWIIWQLGYLHLQVLEKTDGLIGCCLLLLHLVVLQGSLQKEEDLTAGSFVINDHIQMYGYQVGQLTILHNITWMASSASIEQCSFTGGRDSSWFRIRGSKFAHTRYATPQLLEQDFLFRDLGDVAVLDLGCVAQLLSLDPLSCQARGTRYTASLTTMWMSKWPGPMPVRYMLLDPFEPCYSPTSMVNHSQFLCTYHPTWKRLWQSRSQRSWTWHQQSFRHRQP